MSAYAQISKESNSTATTFSSSSSDFSNKVQVTIFDTNGTASNATPDHTNDHITVGVTGVHLVEAVVSFAGPAAQRISMAAFKNNGATKLTIRGTRTGSGPSNVETITISGIVSLTATDTVELWVQNEDGTDSITIEDAILAIQLVEAV